MARFAENVCAVLHNPPTVHAPPPRIPLVPARVELALGETATARVMCNAGQPGSRAAGSVGNAMNSVSGPPFVLVVDDQAAVRDLFASFLRRAGIEVDLACDGADAVGRLRLRVPDAVVCDLDMPNMDGLALCQLLRADAATRSVPVVIVSGAGALALARALEVGCDAVLAKPCSGAVLVATVARLLDDAPTSSILLPPPGLRDLETPASGLPTA